MIRADKQFEQPPIRVCDAWRHQCGAYWFTVDRAAAMLYMGLGTGKSRVVCDLNVNLAHKRTLIITPKSVLNVWPNQFRKWTGQSDTVHVLRGSVKRKCEQLAGILSKPEPAVVLVNYDSARVLPLAGMLRAAMWDCVVGDELHRAKSPFGATSKFMATLRFRAGQRIGLTGTPMPHSPADIWAQYRFLDPTVFGWSFVSFRARYCKMGGFHNKQIVGWQNQDELSRKFHSLAYSVGREVLDLPPALHIERPVELNATTRRVYEDLEEDLIADVRGGVVTAANALVRLLRLSQLTSGFAQVEYPGGGLEIEWLHNAKRDALLDLIEDLPQDEPLVVFAVFRADLCAVELAARKSGRRYGELSGHRNDLTPDATMRDDTQILGVQWKSGGVGVDLTRAAHCAMYSTGYSLGDFEQGICRLHRPGQTRPVRYYHLIAENTVDRKVYAALDSKRDVIASVIKEYEG